MPKFKDPKTGQIVNVDNFLVFLSSLLFGLFFFLYIGETQHALVMVGFAILITLVGIFVSPIAILYAYVFPLIYSFIAPKIVKDKWLNKGYVALDDEVSPGYAQKAISSSPKSEQEELEIWTTFVEYGLQAVNQKYPRYLCKTMFDFTQEKPTISNSIPDDLRIKIEKQWKASKAKASKATDIAVKKIMIVYSAVIFMLLALLLILFVISSIFG